LASGPFRFSGRNYLNLSHLLQTLPPFSSSPTHVRQSYLTGRVASLTKRYGLAYLILRRSFQLCHGTTDELLTVNDTAAPYEFPLCFLNTPARQLIPAERRDTNRPGFRKNPSFFCPLASFLFDASMVDTPRKGAPWKKTVFSSVF